MRHASTYWIFAALLAGSGAHATGAHPGEGPNDFCDETKHGIDGTPTCEQSFAIGSGREAPSPLRDFAWAERTDVQRFGIAFREAALFAGDQPDAATHSATIAELSFADAVHTGRGRMLALSLARKGVATHLHARWLETATPDWSTVTPAPATDQGRQTNVAIELDRRSIPLDAGVSAAQVEFEIDAFGVLMHTRYGTHRFFTSMARDAWRPHRIRAGILQTTDAQAGRALQIVWTGLSD